MSRAIALTRRAGATVAQANSWCEPQVSDDNAKSVRGVVKAKYDEVCASIQTGMDALARRRRLPLFG